MGLKLRRADYNERPYPDHDYLSYTPPEPETRVETSVVVGPHIQRVKNTVRWMVSCVMYAIACPFIFAWIEKLHMPAPIAISLTWIFAGCVIVVLCTYVRWRYVPPIVLFVILVVYTVRGSGDSL